MQILLLRDQQGQFNSVVGICNTKMQKKTVTIAAWAMHEETHVTRLDGLPADQHALAPRQLIPLRLSDCGMRPVPSAPTGEHVKTHAGKSGGPADDTRSSPK